jgi:hypothetical protein
MARSAASRRKAAAPLQEPQIAQAAPEAEAEAQAAWAFPKAADFVGAQESEAAPEAAPQNGADFHLPQFAAWMRPQSGEPNAEQAAAEAEAEAEAELEAAAAKADQIANADAALGKQHNGKPWRYYSDKSIVKPTRKVWFIADAMLEAAEKIGAFAPSRKEVQDYCVELGIASGTARTQYQHWFKENAGKVGAVNQAARLKLEAPQEPDAEPDAEAEAPEIDLESDEE